MKITVIARFLIASFLLGISLSASGAEISYESCGINGRLKFKDQSKGCLVNHPTFFKLIEAQYSAGQFNFYLSTEPQLCPAVFGVNYSFSAGRTSPMAYGCEAALSSAMRGIDADDAARCGCKPVEDIAAGMTKAQFYDYEKQYASRLQSGWTASVFYNSKPVSVAELSIPISPVSPSDARLKADEARRQQEALAKAEDGRRQQALSVKAETSYESCSMNGRLKFKDRSTGCLVNHPTFFKLIEGQYSASRFNFYLSNEPQLCPAVFGVSYATTTSGHGNQRSCETELSSAMRGIDADDAARCGCKPVEDIAAGMTKAQFYDYEKQYASRLQSGWTASVFYNSKPVSVAELSIPISPVSPSDARLKADEARRQQEALAKAEESRRQQEALAKVEETRRQQEALAKAEETRRQQEYLAKAGETRRQQDALAKAEESRRQQEALVQAENARLSAENVKLREQLANKGVSAPVSNRKALIIGNDSYKYVTPLMNAREDARVISENLFKVGYSVSLKLNLTEKQMKEALRVFKGQINPGDEVAIFYAGHGVTLGSANYLLPVDVGGDSEEQIKDESIPLQRFLEDMADRKAKFTLAMIDACRDNPFKSADRAVGGTRGLAATSAVTGQMVIYAAGAGQKALDNLGPADKVKNGLFTRVFVEQMQTPGITINNIMRNVRNEVARLAKTVGHEQVPAMYDQVLGDFYFSN